MQSEKKIEEIIEAISKLSLGEVSELVEGIKAHFKIEESLMVGPATNVVEENKKEEGNNKVSLKLLELGEKIQVYKLISNFYREIKGEEISIIKAKEIADRSDKIIFDNLARDKAKEIKEALEAKGAKIEIKE